MNFLAVLAAIGLEQWRAFHWRVSVERAYVLYVRRIEEKFNGGTRQEGVVAAILALAPPVALAAGVYWLVGGGPPLLGLAWNVALLYLLMGFRRFSHAFSGVAAALKAGDLTGARRWLA